MNSDLTKCKVGDWINTRQEGRVQIKSIKPFGLFPIITDNNAYTFDGRQLLCDRQPSAYTCINANNNNYNCK